MRTGNGLNGWKDRLIGAIVATLLTLAIVAISLGPRVTANDERSRDNEQKIEVLQGALGDHVTRADLRAELDALKADLKDYMKALVSGGTPPADPH